MREYLKQFYTEGFATIFYTRPVNYLNKKIKNKKIANFIALLIKILYTVLVLTFAGYYLYAKLK